MTQPETTIVADLHRPVLLNEVIELLQPERGGVFVDATLGMGGHSEALLQRAKEHKENIQIFGLDQDTEALGFAKERLGEQIEYMWGNFADLPSILKKREITGVDGILMDLGVSSYQLDTAERGFSFTNEGFLDMRMNETGTVTAASIVNTWPEAKLADMIYEYGEERLSRKIARVIVERRQKEKFVTTIDLAELIVGLYPARLRHKRPHPATRTFQALRIEVNDELRSLREGLAAAISLLNPGGILAVISFHSLEDRIVKHYFRELARDGGYEVLTKRPINAGVEELEQNPRSRSSKLRGLRRIS